jgi:hypothetical protein
MTLIRIVSHFDRVLAIEEFASFWTQNPSLYTKILDLLVKKMRPNVPKHAVRKGEMNAENALF